MEEDAQHATEQGQKELPLNGSDNYQPEKMQDCIRRAAAMPIRQVPREELGPLPAFTIPTNTRSGPPTVGIIVTEQRNTYASLAPLGSGIEGRDNERLSLSSL